jgi:hypothetical protein
MAGEKLPFSILGGRPRHAGKTFVGGHLEATKRPLWAPRWIPTDWRVGKTSRSGITIGFSGTKCQGDISYPDAGGSAGRIRTVSGRTGAKLALCQRGSSPSIIQDSMGVRFSKVVGPAKHLLEILFLDKTVI